MIFQKYFYYFNYNNFCGYGYLRQSLSSEKYAKIYMDEMKVTSGIYS
jgi:hypothetical protein